MTHAAHADIILRAAEQMAAYTFRRMTVKTSAGPVPIIYVYGPNDTYQVTPGRHHYRCSCPHYTKRCAGTLEPCKHVVMARSWEERERRAQCEAQLAARAAEVERAVEKAARMRRQMAADFPEFD